MAKKNPKAQLDSVVVITVLTTNSDRRDQIDQLIDKAFAADPRVQVVRVVGYPSGGTANVGELASMIDEVAGEVSETASPPASVT